MAEKDTDDQDAPGGGHGHRPAHAVDEEPLGPVDLSAWAYAVVGSLLGVVVVLALYLASGG